MKMVVGAIAGFGILTVVFFVLQRIWPAEPGLAMVRRGYRLDAIYWLFTALITSPATKLLTGIVAAVLVVAFGHGLTRDDILRGHGPLSQTSLWLQGALLVAALDFAGYWSHRLFHGRRLWPFHAIHHSSVDLDWLSATRLHPINDLVSLIQIVVPFLLLGLSPATVVSAVPLLTLYAILLHANLDWDFGPLRYVAASPVFHRWHHTCEEEGRDKNFAGLLPAWDLLFGTFYMPRSHRPRRFGTCDPVAESLGGQLRYPFRRRPMASIA